MQPHREPHARESPHEPNSKPPNTPHHPSQLPPPPHPVKPPTSTPHPPTTSNPSTTNPASTSNPSTNPPTNNPTPNNPPVSNPSNNNNPPAPEKPILTSGPTNTTPTPTTPSTPTPTVAQPCFYEPPKPVAVPAVPSVATPTSNANDLGQQHYTQKTNDPSIISVRLSNKNITFVSGWQHNDANNYFSNDVSKRLQYSAKLDHAAYIQIPQAALGNDANDVTKDFVADFDGHVDVVTIDAYSDLDSIGPNGFSIEFWMRVTTPNSCAVFTKGTLGSYMQLNLSNGKLVFTMFNGSASFSASTPENSIVNGNFYHVTITGSLQSSIKFYLTGAPVADTPVRGFTSMPGAGYPMILGQDTIGQDFSKFTGQLTALYIFKNERSTAEVQCNIRSKPAQRNDLANIVGRWELTLSNRIPLTYYYVTDANEGEDLDPDSMYSTPPATLPLVANPADVPLRAVVDNNLLYVFRQTTGLRIIADIFQLNGTSLVPVGASGQVLNVADCYRGWFTVVKVNQYWVVFNCGNDPQALASARTAGDKIFWNTFQVTNNVFSPVTAAGYSGLLVPKRDGTAPISFVTHPTALYQNGHLILSVSTNDSARVLMVDWAVGSDGKLTSVNGDVSTPRVGIDYTNVGTTMYAAFVSPLGGSPTATNILATGYQITNPNSDFRSKSTGQIVRFRHTYVSGTVEPPFQCLSGLSLSNGVLVPSSQVGTINLNPEDLFPISLFRIVNLSSPGSPNINDGDAISLQVLIPQPNCDPPRIGVVTWVMSSPNNYRPSQTCKWTISTQPYDGKITNANQVFGVFGVDCNTDDQNNPLTRSPSNMTRILIAPGVFQNSINSNMLASGVSVTSFPPLRDEEFMLRNRMGDNGMPVVYVDRFNRPEPLSLYSGYYLSHSEKPTDTNNNRRNFQWAQRKLTSTNYLMKDRINYVDNTTPSLHWWWYSWKVTSFYGGYNLQGGQEILIEGIDPNNDIGMDQPNKWARLNVNKVEQPNSDEAQIKFNFWIFKVDRWDAQVKTLTLDTIHVNDWVLLWPRTPDWQQKFARRALPSPTDLNDAITQFGSGSDSLFQPFQLQLSQAQSLPCVNDVSMENAKVKDLNTAPLPQTSVSGLRIGLLNFVRTVTVPTLCTIPNSPAIRMTFKGNGHPLKLANNLVEISDQTALNNQNFYQEGTAAQAMMTTGLFYRVDYVPPTGNQVTGLVSNMSRIDGLHSFEFPKAIPGFIWTVPPPYKVTGITEVIGQYAHQGWSLDYLQKVIRSVAGIGTFHEGIWKPCVSIPFNNSQLDKIRVSTQNIITAKIGEKIPNWEAPDTAARDAAPLESYFALSDVITANALNGTAEWQGKINMTAVNSTYNSITSSTWFSKELKTANDSVADPELRNNMAKYASYGGVAALMKTSLTSTAFLNQLILLDQKDLSAVLKTQLYVLSVFDSAASADAASTITAALIADQVINDPSSILNTASRNQVREAYAQMIIAACDNPQDTNSSLVISFLQTWIGSLTSVELSSALARISTTDVDAVRGFLKANNQGIASQLAETPDLNTRSAVFSRGATVLTTAAAIYVIIQQSGDQSTDEARLALTATIISAAGGMLETVKIMAWLGMSVQSLACGSRAVSAAAAAEQGATAFASGFDRLAVLCQQLGPFFQFMAVVADAITFCLAVKKLVSDIEGGQTDSYTIGMDAAGIVVAAAGLVSAFGLMAGAAFAGPLAGVVFAVSVALIIVDQCHQKEEQRKQEEEAARARERYQQWVNWGRHLLANRHFLLPNV